jgi:hypothetical protein
MSNTKRKDEDHGLQNALAGYDNIREMVAAMECDYERLQELREMKADGDTIMDADEAQELTDLESAAGDCEDQDAARERISEDALEVCIRSGWYAPGGDATPSEFYILLTTGGPALRLRGELNQHSEPSRAWLEYQDWSTPWTQLVNDSAGAQVDQDVLLTYAGCFYFGEG